MAVINLETSQISSINSEITALDQTLLQSYLPELNSELSAIRGNVKNAEINQLLSTISSQFDGVKATLQTELPRLEQFLTEQMQTYDMQEEEALQELINVLARMDSMAKGVSISAAGGAAGSGSGSSSDSNASSSSSEVDQLRSEVEGLKGDLAEANKSNFQRTNEEFVNDFLADGKEYGSRVANDWTNVGEAFANGNIISGVGNTLGATFTTVGNTVGLAYGEVMNSADWVLDATFGTDTLVGKLGDWLS